MSPEMVREEGYSGFGSDIWSLGVLLYFLFVGTFPFLAEEREELDIKIHRYEIEYWEQHQAARGWDVD